MCCNNNFLQELRGQQNRRRTRLICECREIRDHHQCGCKRCKRRREREFECRCREVSR